YHLVALRPPPRSPLFPYTTLFRSLGPRGTHRTAPPHSSFSSSAGGRAKRWCAGMRISMPRIWPNGRTTPERNSPFVCNAKLGGRSEEHTSELQSRENLVCRLLLEK